MANYIPSKMQTSCECFICHKPMSAGLDHHHCLHGSGTRKICDEDGYLWVWLCRKCHSALHDKGEHDKELKQYAQQVYIREKMKEGYPEDAARELFKQRYGRFYDV